MSSALELCFGMPLWLGYMIVSALAVIPLVTHGITWISRFQIWTQPLWIGLNILPVGFILYADWRFARRMDELSRACRGADATIDILKFGGARLGDPRPDAADRRAGRRAALPAAARTKNPAQMAPGALAAGPGWIVLGAPEAPLRLVPGRPRDAHGVPASHAAEPAQMYRIAFGYVLPWPRRRWP